MSEGEDTTQYVPTANPTGGAIKNALARADAWEKCPTRPGTPGWGPEVDGLITLAAAYRAARREAEEAKAALSGRTVSCVCGGEDVAALQSKITAANARIAEMEKDWHDLVMWWCDTEARSSEAHAVYQEEAHRRGDVRHPDAYADLSEPTKEWDRVLVRWFQRELEIWHTPGKPAAAEQEQPKDTNAKV